jgi:ubiquinone/menaquinone biosynthesis C-methylase UbiE
MLQEFRAGSENCFLAQADGRQLPFRDGTFDLVLLMQVLSSLDDWPAVLEEVRRVVRSGGVVAVGHTVSPESGIDVKLKRQLTTILEEMHVAWRRPEEPRRQALAWLKSVALRHLRIKAASWNVSTSAEEFLRRHRTGARFSALPVAVQEEALAKLRAWVGTNFGAVDARFQEERYFELDVFEL